MANVQQWLADYRTAWITRDSDLITTLFTEHCVYRETPHGEPHFGRDGVRAYWDGVTATQSDIELRYGKVVGDDTHAAVEWWVTMDNGGIPVTLAGEFMLVFDDAGLCSELREYWFFIEGRTEPPAGWGE